MSAGSSTSARQARPARVAALVAGAILGATAAHALAQDAPPAPEPSRPAALDAALNLPVRIGAPWRETEDQLFGVRCLAEDSPLVEAVDCRSDLTLGPFSASGPAGDGIAVYSDDGLTVTRVAATRSTDLRPLRCDPFLRGVSQALAAMGVQATLARTASGLRLQANGELRLSVDCQPETQTLELADPWIDLVPGGSCPDLVTAPPDLRAVADTAMTKVVHDDPDELGTACNRPRFPISVFAGRMMAGLVVAYQSLSLEVPGAPPDWLLSQIRGGLANLRAQGAALHEPARSRFEAYLQRATSSVYLRSLWKRVVRSEQGARNATGTVKAASPTQSGTRKHHP